MKRYYLLGAIGALSLMLSLSVTHQALAADPTLTATTTVANVDEVKASRTIGVAALPANAETFTIGSCVVTFTTVASSTTDELNCNDNAASIDRTLSTGDTSRTVAQVATQIQSLTNASSSGTHGALTVASTSATTTSFTTTNTESSATAITFTDGTSGDIVSLSSTTGVVPVAQVVTFTPADVTVGSEFTATITGENSPVDGTPYSYTAVDNTAKDVVEGLNAAMASDPDVDCTENDAVLTCTSSTAGADFDYDTEVTPSTPPVVHHHSGGGGGGGGGTTTTPPSTPPAGCLPGFAFSTLTGQACPASTTPAGCFPGALFSTTTGQSCGFNPGPGTSPAPVITVTFTQDMTLGSTGSEVIALQTILVGQGYLVMPPGVAMGYFGALTQAALAKFQASVGISPAVGYFGPITRAYMNSH